MGCGSSTDGSGGSSQPYNRRPKISVRIQSNVQKLSEADPCVVFIFGGPGSRKGRIIDDLVTSYGFTFISGEDLILEHLPEKLGCDGNTGLRAMLQDERCEQITLAWLLELVAKEIDSGPSNGGRYVVDILPTLRYLLRVNSMVKECQTAISTFEEKYSVAFALNLAIPVDKVLKTKQVYCAEPGKTDKLSKDGQSDEADSTRTQRRASQYEQHVRTYLDYFSRSERLITVDVSGGNADTIWHRVHELMSCDLDVRPLRTVNTVIVFSFEDSDLSSVDCDKYSVDCLRLADIAPDADTSPDKLLRILSEHIDSHSLETESFAVMCEGTTLGKRVKKMEPELFAVMCEGKRVKKPSKRHLVFEGTHPHPVHTYLPGNPTNHRGNISAYSYKAMSSLENEICLFPSDTDDVTCRAIAATMAKQREVD